MLGREPEGLAAKCWQGCDGSRVDGVRPRLRGDGWILHLREEQLDVQSVVKRLEQHHAAACCGVERDIVGDAEVVWPLWGKGRAFQCVR
jgi:hypothetical protein